ncbi:Nn.00g032590.m01.CDS01 [Neocucurbitaria sp. VM-36]
MAFTSLLVALLTARSGVSAIASANIAFEDVKFFIKLILIMLLVLLLSQYRSSRRTKKLLKKIEYLGKQQERVTRIERRLTNVLEQLDIMKKHDLLVLNQLEQMAYWSCKQGSDVEKRIDALGNDMGRLVMCLGDMHTRIAVMSGDMQLARRLSNGNKPVHKTSEDYMNPKDERFRDLKGSEHYAKVDQQERKQMSVAPEDVEPDIVCTSTAALDEYDDGADWESVAIRIDRLV